MCRLASMPPKVRLPAGSAAGSGFSHSENAGKSNSPWPAARTSQQHCIVCLLAPHWGEHFKSGLDGSELMWRICKFTLLAVQGLLP